MPRKRKPVETKSVYPGRYVTEVPRVMAIQKGPASRIDFTTPHGGPHKQVEKPAPSEGDWE